MAGAGLAGLAQGLASSPLGNLPALMQAKESMEMQRERNAWEKADREAAVQAAQARQQYQAGLSDAITQGGAEAGAEYALSHGDTDGYKDIMSIQIDADKNLIALGELDHKRKTLEEQKSKNALEKQQLRNEIKQGEFDVANAYARNFARTIQMQRTGDPKHDAMIMDREVKSLRAANPRMAALVFGTGHRTPQGVSVVNDPQTGEAMYAMNVYNPDTKSVGPETVGQSSRATDQVQAYTGADIDQMLHQMSRAGMEPEKLEYQEGPGGRPMAFDPVSGGMMETRLSGGAEFDRKLSLGNETLNEIYASNPSILGATQGGERAKLRSLAGTLMTQAIRDGMNPQEAANKAAATIESRSDPVQQYSKTGGLEEQQQILNEIYSGMMGRKKNTLAAATPKRKKPPSRVGKMPRRPQDWTANYSSGLGP